MKTEFSPLYNERRTSELTACVSGLKPVLVLLTRLLLATALLLSSVGASARVVLTTLHSFNGTNDGTTPAANLVQGSDSDFYGTTHDAGIHGAYYGTVFKISTNGALTTLYAFGAITNSDGYPLDGSMPQGALAECGDGNFYGTTDYGGTNDTGSVFRISTNGLLTSLYSFTGGDDGAYPYVGLVQGSDGNFYGATMNGGAYTNQDGYGFGTLFKISANGLLTSLYSFTGGDDGQSPSGLVQGRDGDFYGTTYDGGIHGAYYGTVFKINTDGALTTLYAFGAITNSKGDPLDGANPYGRMVQGTDGNFYGTTVFGATNGAGSVFRITTNGGLTTLYSFGTIPMDGAHPVGGLVQGSNGNFYGITQNGGTSGVGSVFQISSNGALTSLYSFGIGNHGFVPIAGLAQGRNGKFYGTTELGGSSDKGTVFSLSLGFTIMPTFDSSITNDPNGPAMIAAIDAAIQALETNIADNFTVYIKYENDTSTEDATNGTLGTSQTWATNYSYSSYLEALKASATDVNDSNAISQLPNSSTDPVIGGNQINVNLALARLLGLASSEGDDGFDSTISLVMSRMNLTRPSTNSENYDLQSTVEHENDEVLGTPSTLPDDSPISPMDLFRYTTNLDRTFTTNGADDAYFSVDGTNLWARFNMNMNGDHTGGDYSDWWSPAPWWSPPGDTPHEQVQDAFGTPGTVLDLGTNELTMLDVIGWTLIANVTQAAPPMVSIINSGDGQITLFWPTNLNGYVLQESTSLASSNSWVASATGSANPAVILITNSQTYFRLYQAASSSLARANRVAVRPSKSTSLKLTTRVFKARQP